MWTFNFVQSHSSLSAFHYWIYTDQNHPVTSFTWPWMLYFSTGNYNCWYLCIYVRLSVSLITLFSSSEFIARFMSWYKSLAIMNKEVWPNGTQGSLLYGFTNHLLQNIIQIFIQQFVVCKCIDSSYLAQNKANPNCIESRLWWWF